MAQIPCERRAPTAPQAHEDRRRRGDISLNGWRSIQMRYGRTVIAAHSIAFESLWLPWMGNFSKQCWIITSGRNVILHSRSNQAQVSRNQSAWLLLRFFSFRTILRSIAYIQMWSRHITRSEEHTSEL